MNATPQPQSSPNTITHPLAKFAIGLTAGLVAVIIPRLSSDLSASEVFSTDFYTPVFIISILVFALLIGIVICILEYKVPRTPKDTLFSALAIPALVAGSLNTAIETQNTNEIQNTVSQISQEALRTNQIEIEPIKSIEVIQLLDSTSNNTQSINVSFFASAHADSPNDSQTLNTPIQKSQKQLFINRQPEIYAVSILQFEKQTDAIQQARQLKSQLPNLSVIKIHENRYNLITKQTLMTKTDATLEALKTKNDFKLNPVILKLQ